MQPQQQKSEAQNAEVESLAPNGNLPCGQLRIPTRLIAPLCLLTICAILVAGLWPFRAPTNQVTWIQGENGIRFGTHGTALSTEALAIGGGGGACTIELWIEPAEIWTTGSILTFYNPQAAREFSIQQDFADLLLTNGSVRDGGKGRQELRVENVFRDKQPFITITSDGRQTVVYVDGRLATSSPGFILSSRDLAGQIIVATSALRNHGWSGDLKGLAIYSTALVSAQVQQHYASWTNLGAPQLDKNTSAVAVYALTEHGGSAIASVIGSAPTLNIPERFGVIDQLRFESPVSEFRSQDTYLKNALTNVAGFVPLGFVCGLYLRVVRKTKYVTLKTILVGATVSLAIEYFQSYLPTRFSGITDLITNTAGTWLGVVLCSYFLSLSSRYRAGHFAVQPSKERL